MQKPILVLIRGLPGSGKSYLADALRKRLNADSVVLLDPDDIDQNSDEYKELSGRLTEEGVDAKFHPYRYSRGRAHQGIEEGKVIIWNQAFTNLDGFQKTVANLQNYAAERELRLQLLVVEVGIDSEAARSRVADRAAAGGHDVPAENFERFMSEYRSFSDEGYDTIAVDGAGDIDQSVEKVLEYLRNL